MKRHLLATAIATLAQAGVGQALTLEAGDVPPSPVTASAGMFAFSDFVIAGGGQLPGGLEARDVVGSLVLDTEAGSTLAAPDAVPFEDSDTVIAGFEAATPSVFSKLSRSSRNAGTEGAFGNVVHQIYQARELDVDADGTNDVSERGVRGESQAQIGLDTALYDADASGDVNSERRFIFTNNRDTPFTFGIEGEMNMSLFALAEGPGAASAASAVLEMIFTGNGPLDIQFGATAPLLLEEDADAPGGIASLLAETDVAGTGRLSLTGGVSAQSEGFSAPVEAFATGSFGFALGVTLQPGQELGMLHRVAYSSEASFALPQAPQVPLPGGLPLLAAGLGGFAWVRSRTKNAPSEEGASRNEGQ